MNILITGSMGQLGRSLRRSMDFTEHQCICTDLRGTDDVLALDITDPDAVRKFVENRGIDVIVNCAAYTNVAKAEDEEEVAFRVNALAPGILAAAAKEADALLVHVSTDYVFDGKGCQPYTEDMPAHPVNAYGRTKLAGEKAVVESGCRYMIFRTSWLYSPFGGNFVQTIYDKTASQSSIQVVSDQVGTPTFAQDLADTIGSIIDDNMLDKTGIYNYSNEGVCSWYDLAKEICDMCGRLCHVIPCRTTDYPSNVARPQYSVMDKTKVKTTFGVEIPHWKDSLAFCLRMMEENEL